MAGENEKKGEDVELSAPDGADAGKPAGEDAPAAENKINSNERLEQAIAERDRLKSEMDAKAAAAPATTSAAARAAGETAMARVRLEELDAEIAKLREAGGQPAAEEPSTEQPTAELSIARGAEAGGEAGPPADESLRKENEELQKKLDELSGRTAEISKEKEELAGRLREMNIARLEVARPSEIEAADRRLLAFSKKIEARLPVDDVDLLVVDEIGKDVSGVGLDPHVIGRMKIRGEAEPSRPRVKCIVLRGLSRRSAGNALGVGFGDFITARLRRQIDEDALRANILTAKFPERGKIPVTLPTDRAAVEAGLAVCWGVKPREARIIKIRNTLRLGEMFVSEAVMRELCGRPGIRPAGRAVGEWFDKRGNICGKLRL